MLKEIFLVLALDLLTLYASSLLKISVTGGGAASTTRIRHDGCFSTGCQDTPESDRVLWAPQDQDMSVAVRGRFGCVLWQVKFPIDSGRETIRMEISSSRFVIQVRHQFVIGKILIPDVDVLRPRRGDTDANAN